MTTDELKSWIEAAEKRAAAADEGGPWMFHWDEERARFINAARTDLPRMAALLRAALAVVEISRSIGPRLAVPLGLDGALAAFDAEVGKA